MYYTQQDAICHRQQCTVGATTQHCPLKLTIPDKHMTSYHSVIFNQLQAYTYMICVVTSKIVNVKCWLIVHHERDICSPYEQHIEELTKNKKCLGHKKPFNLTYWPILTALRLSLKWSWNNRCSNCMRFTDFEVIFISSKKCSNKPRVKYPHFK